MIIEIDPSQISAKIKAAKAKKEPKPKAPRKPRAKKDPAAPKAARTSKKIETVLMTPIIPDTRPDIKNLVTRTNFDEVVAHLKSTKLLALDTETTGLNPYKFDQLFSIIIGDDTEQYYFNFIPYPEYIGDDYILHKGHMEALQNELFFENSTTWVLHNAKFDMRMLAKSSLYLCGSVYCTMANHRVLVNNLQSYSLANLSKGSGDEKSDEVKKYIKEHGLHKMEYLEGKKEEKKSDCYDKVPLPLMCDYACRDIAATFSLYLKQVKIAENIALEVPNIYNCLGNEQKLTKTLFRAEHIGIKVDINYCITALISERKKVKLALEAFKALTNHDLVDSGKDLGGLLTEYGIKLQKSEKSNEWKVDSYVLENIKDEKVMPIIKEVMAYRESTKQANTYFANLIDLADKNDCIHTNMFQSGTITGRLSCTDPNLQNLPKFDEDNVIQQDFPVRRAFIPRDGFCFLSVDYEQQEYRLLLDYAKEQSLIEKVKGGLDVHQATADLVGVTRKQAKILNFALLYGMGDASLSKKMNISLEEAKQLKSMFFAKLPQVAAFIKFAVQRAGDKGYLKTWLGRYLRFDQKKYNYFAVNHLIQGGSADITKMALNNCHDYLVSGNYQSRILLSIHDEIIFEVHKTELYICPELCRIMERAYPHKHLQMGADPAYSWTNLQDKIKGLPI